MGNSANRIVEGTQQRRSRTVPGRATAAGIGWLLLALLAIGCGSSRPDIVLVTIDGARADRIGALGDESARTPVLDALAADGALFSRAFASSPLTLPSHATILTGLEPQQHGIRDEGEGPLPAEIATVAERLSAAGYETAAFVGSERLERSRGLDQGFAVYDDAVAPGGESLRASLPRRNGERVVEQALRWLEQEHAGPRFLWVHLADLEAPRSPPAPFDEIEDTYAATLTYVDTQIGRLLGGLEDRANTVFLVVGDHGTALGENGERGHGLLASDVTLHVPILVSGPGFPPGARSDSLVTTADVAATLVAAGGESSPGPEEAVTLSTALSSPAPGERVAYFETLAPAHRLTWSPIRGVRDARWKLVAEPAPAALYDLDADPAETDDRSAAEPEVVARLTRAYEAALALDEGDGLPDVAAPPPGGPGPVDPRQHIDELPAVEMARGIATRGRVSESLAALEIMGTDWPTLRVPALEASANIARAAGLTDRAVADFRAWIALTGSVDAKLGLAGTLTDAGRYEEVLAALEGAPDDEPRVRVVRGEALRLLGREDEALAEAEAVLERVPEYDSAIALVSLVRAGRDGASVEIDRLTARLRESQSPGRLVQSRAVLAQLLTEQHRYEDAARVLGAFPGAPSRHLAMLAQILAQHGRSEQAIELYERALVARPTDPGYRRALADLYGDAGRFQDAIAVYDALLALDPENAGYYVDRGAMRHSAGDVAGGEADYRKALELDPNLPEVHYNLALIAKGADREDEAIAQLEQAVALRADYPRAHLMLARIYGSRDDPRSAYHAEQAVLSDPSPVEGKDPHS